MIKRYRKKPVAIEAVQWTGNHVQCVRPVRCRTVKVWSYKYCFGGPCKHQEKLNLCRYCYDNMIKYLKKIKEETK